jgi:hypothetical protein
VGWSRVRRGAFGTNDQIPGQGKKNRRHRTSPPLLAPFSLATQMGALLLNRADVEFILCSKKKNKEKGREEVAQQRGP